MMKRRLIQDTLTPAAIDRMAEVCAEALGEAQADSRDILRLRLSLEEILGCWLSSLPSGARLTCRTDTRWGRQSMEVRVGGERLDPSQALDEDGEPLLFAGLLAQTSLSLVYEYRDGANCLFLRLPRKARMGQLSGILLAMLAALGIGGAASVLPGLAGVLQAVADPLFNTMLGCLRALAGPMIFLAVCGGIISIGDVSAVGQIGRKVIVRITLHTFLISAVCALCLTAFFPLTLTQGGAGGGFRAIYEMILGIVPSDIVSPFLTGNALQIIFMAAAVGVGLLVLGGRASTLRDIVGQANQLVQFLMEMLCRLVPFFVFLSMLSLMLSGALGNVQGMLKALLLVVAGCLALCAAYVLALAVRFKTGVLTVARKLLPTWLIGVTTASSTAAFATNLETCEKRLGVSPKLVSFAVPLGQVLYMPGGVAAFLGIALCMAQNYGVAITPVWLITAIIVSGLLAMASSPVPGGALSCYTILLAQLGIPAEALATAIAVDMLADFVVTAANLLALQAETTLAAAGLGMLNETRLKSETEVSA